jgi:hypothetical protein
LHGIKWESGREPRAVGAGDDVAYNGAEIGLFWRSERWYVNGGYTKITMEDFTVNKKTKTEYIKTDKEIWDLKEEFKAGLVFTRTSMGKFNKIPHIQSLAQCLYNHNVYIKTEIEIPWHERLDDFSYPLAMIYIESGSFSVWRKEELIWSSQGEYRPATKAEIQVLLNNAPE